MISKSSGKITKVSNADDVEIKYGHIIQVLTDWIDTTILVSVDGRGTAKSTVIQARRSARCVEEMPGGAFAFVANTYSNLEDNIMPAVQKGWQLMGLIEGVHYIKIPARLNPGGVNVRLSWMITSMFTASGTDALFSWDHWITLRCLPESL